MTALSFAVLCSFHVYFIFWDRRSLQIRYAVPFKHGFVHAVPFKHGFVHAFQCKDGFVHLHSVDFARQEFDALSAFSLRHVMWQRVVRERAGSKYET